MALKLLHDEDVLLPDILFEVEYAKVFDRVPLETPLQADEEETRTLLNDDSGPVEKMILAVEDGGILEISAMEETGKLEMETL